MTPSIRRTLLQNLFLRPRPVERESFLASRTQLFPSEPDFLAFLQTDSEQEMTQRARTILLDLIFSARCPPPSHLIVNLLATQQERLHVVTEGDYVPRDHFVHLVHLYLLGIYLFAYHPSLHRRCHADLTRERRRATVNGPLAFISPYELFSVVWKQFVLYHDLGYPLERLPPAERDTPDGKKWLRPFQKVIKSLHKDISFKAIARITVARSLLEEHQTSTFDETFLAHLSYLKRDGDRYVPRQDDYPDASNDAAELTKWMTATSLPHVNGPRDLSIVLSVVPKLEFCAYLEAPDGSSHLAVVGPFESAKYVSGPPNYLPGRVRKLAGTYSEQEVLLKGHVPRSDYRWHYFALAPGRAVEEAIDKLIPSTRRKAFDLLAKDVEARDDYRSERAKAVDNAPRLTAIVYLTILHLRGYLAHDDEEEDARAFQRAERLLKAVYDTRETAIGKIPSLIGRAYESFAKGIVRDNSASILKMLETEGGIAAADSMLARLQKAQTQIAKSVAADVEREISTPLVLRRSVRECTNAIRETIIKVVAGRRAAPSQSAELFTEHFSLAKALAEAKNLSTRLDARLERRGLGPLLDLAKGYLPDWVKQDDANFPDKKDFIDHGFASAAVLLTAGREFEACISTIEAGKAKLLEIAFGMLPKQPQQLAELKLDHALLVTHTAEAVALHNLYPSFLTGKRGAYRTRMPEQAFAFLAILADSLQKWDRRCLMKEAPSRVDTFVPGSRYDIRIRDSSIYIRMTNDRLDVRKQAADLRSSLAHYLQDGDSLIRLQLEEL